MFGRNKKNKSGPVGQIGYCDNSKLGIDKPGGHYVYIRSVEGGKCDVNVVTSLERGKEQFISAKIKHIRKGYTYPIPYYDADFREWSGIKNNAIKGVSLSEVRNIGVKGISDKHKAFINKHLK